MKDFGRFLAAGGLLLAASAAFAANVPVAKDYPDWTGVGQKPPAFGRELTPSDLRHKATVIVEFEANPKLAEQLALAAPLVSRSGIGSSCPNDCESWTVPRNVVVVFSNCSGGKGRNALQAFAEYKEKDATILRAAQLLRGLGFSVYDNVTFDGAPSGAGKRPFVYVMGPTGKTPLYQGELKADAVKAAAAAVDKAAKSVGAWRPFYGTVTTSEYNEQIEKALADGKPLKPVEQKLLKDIVSKDEAKAKTAQILYDALNQTRNDLVLKIQMEASTSPAVAAYDLQRLLRCWPSEKKRVEEAMAKVQANPDLAMMAKIYCKVKAWSDPGFTCKNAAEAKKIVAELNKMKKQIDKFKDSTSTPIQTARLLLEPKIDELVSTVPTKCP